MEGRAGSFRWLGLLVVALCCFGGLVVDGADLQWQKPVPRDGTVAEISFSNGNVFQFWWFSPYIPQSEQRLASWPGRFPKAGDHTLVDDVVDTDSDSEDLDTGPYSVSLTQDLVRCQQLTIGGSWDQEMIIEEDGGITVGFTGSSRDCPNTRSFGPGLREGKRGDNIIYLAAQDSNEESVGAGSDGDPTYWVVAVQFEGNTIEESTTPTQVDHEDGTYTIAYQAPGVCGSAVLFVGCGTLTLAIPGSPFLINFFDCDPPPVSNATIARNGVQLEIYFDYGSDLGGFDGTGFDCTELLEYEEGLFGDPDEVYCYWRLPELLILVFGSRARVLPGDRFILLGGFIRGAPPLQTPTLNQTDVTVEMYDDSHPPRLHICGPEILPSCVDKVSFEASSSRGTGGREFVYDAESIGIGMFDEVDTDSDSDFDSDTDTNDTDSDSDSDVDEDDTDDDPDAIWKYNPNYERRYTTLTPIQWSLLAPSEGDDYVATILANVTDNNYYGLEFEVDELQIGVEYVFLAQATNYLGQYSSTLHSYTVVRNETTPVAHIYAPTTLQMYRSSPLILLCEAMEMCDAQSILFSNRTRLDYFWTVTTEAYGETEFETVGTNNGVPEYAVSTVFESTNVQGDTPILEIPGNQMTFGFDYTYTCYVSIGEGAPETGQGSDSVQVELVSAPLLPCSVDGPVRTIYSELEFLMDGSCSIDPNGPNEEEPLMYQWCCIYQTFPFEGQSCDNTAFPLGGECSNFSATVPARSFNSQTRQFQPGDFLFTLNLRQGDRTASYEVLISVISEEIPTIHTLEMDTYLVDTTQSLLLKGSIDNDFVSSLGNIDLQYWTVDPPYFPLDDASTLSDCGVNCSFLYLKPEYLTQGVRFDFTYHFRIEGVDAESLAGITVVTKENPQGGFCTAVSENPDTSATTNRNFRCFEYERNLDTQYVDYYFLDPLIDQKPYPRLLAAPVVCSNPLLVPPGTHTLFSKIINGVSSRTIDISTEEAQRPEFDFHDVRGVIDTLQLTSGLMGRYNNFLQVSFFLLNMINYRISYYEPDMVDGFPNFVCLPLSQVEQLQLSVLREQIFISFASLYVFDNKDIYFFENVAYMVDSAVSPCSIHRTQFIDREVTVYLTDFNLLQDMQLFRQTDTAGTFFAKGMQDVLLNVQNSDTIWFAGGSECTRVGGKVWEFMLALSLSYMIDGVPGVDPSCIQWDRVWFCDFKDAVDDMEVPNRQTYSNRAVTYILSDEVMANLQVEDGGDIYDVVLTTSDYQPDECRYPNQMVSAYSNFRLKVDLGITPFEITRLNDPIRVTLPYILEEGEMASTPFPAYYDVDDEVYRTDGLTLVESSFQYPGFFYQGFMIFTTDHATSFASVQDVPIPDEFDPDDPVIELWWFISFAVAFILFVFIGIFVPIMWREYSEKKQAAYEFPQPPPHAMGGGIGMDHMGGGDEFGGWEDEGEGEFYDEDEEYYEDGDYDEEEE